MTKRIISFILSIMMVIFTFAVVTTAFADESAVSVWDGSYSGGSTSDWAGYANMTEWFNAQKDNAVIEVGTAKQFAALAYLGGRSSWDGWGGVATTFESKTIKLTSDIDLDSKQWVPICYDPNYPFLGTFDGNGHTIKNLYAKDYENYGSISFSRSSFGVFGTMGGTIKNIKVDGIIIDVDLSRVNSKPINARMRL